MRSARVLNNNFSIATSCKSQPTRCNLLSSCVLVFLLGVMHSSRSLWHIISLRTEEVFRPRFDFFMRMTCICIFKRWLNFRPAIVSVISFNEKTGLYVVLELCGGRGASLCVYACVRVRACVRACVYLSVGCPIIIAIISSFCSISSAIMSVVRCSLLVAATI